MELSRESPDHCTLQHITLGLGDPPADQLLPALLRPDPAPALRDTGPCAQPCALSSPSCSTPSQPAGCHLLCPGHSLKALEGRGSNLRPAETPGSLDFSFGSTPTSVFTLATLPRLYSPARPLDSPCAHVVCTAVTWWPCALCGHLGSVCLCVGLWLPRPTGMGWFCSLHCVLSPGHRKVFPKRFLDP